MTDLKEVAPVGNERFGSLRFSTNDLLAGILRRNGVAYSDQSTLAVYWKVWHHLVPQVQFLIVSAALHDPVYLVGDYYYTATFQKEMDGFKWHPTPCSLTATPRKRGASGGFFAYSGLIILLG